MARKTTKSAGSDVVRLVLEIERLRTEDPEAHERLMRHVARLQAVAA